ncbi:MAG: DUF6481 family protein [Rhizobiaceae bacterium]
MFADKRPDFQKRQSDAAAARQELLEKARKVAEDPGLAERKLQRAETVRAREIRAVEREAARKARKAELAAEAVRTAEEERKRLIEEEKLAEMMRLDEADREVALLAEQKAARDARYAARKAAKKQRRKGT